MLASMTDQLAWLRFVAIYPAIRSSASTTSASEARPTFENSVRVDFQARIRCQLPIKITVTGTPAAFIDLYHRSIYV